MVGTEIPLCFKLRKVGRLSCNNFQTKLFIFMRDLHSPNLSPSPLVQLRMPRHVQGPSAEKLIGSSDLTRSDFHEEVLWLIRSLTVPIGSLGSSRFRDGQ